MNEEIQNEWADIENAGSPKPASDAAEPESAEQIRAEIEETRAEMSQTIDALQDKLNPQHIKSQVAEKVHDATIGRAQDLVHSASEKLAPAGEKISEVVAPAAQSAKEKGAPVLQFVQQKPVVFAAIVAAVLAFIWGVLREDDDEITLR